MNQFINFCVAMIALLHFWFCILEMFLWEKPIGKKIFNLTSESARISAPLAANQGLYNLMLSAGLLWSVLANNLITAIQLKLFFLTWVSVAGIYAGLTVNRRIFFVQALPGLFVLSFVMYQVMMMYLMLTYASSM